MWEHRIRAERRKKIPNKNLISILEHLKPENEICVEIYECISEKFADSTYAIGYDLNEYQQLVLKADVEKDKFPEIFALFY